MTQRPADPAPQTIDAPPPDHGRAGRNLPAAIGVGVALIAAVTLTLAWWSWGFVLLVAAALCAGALEIHQALLRKGMESSIVPILLGTFAIVIGSYHAGHPLRLEGDRVVVMPSNTLLLAGLALTVTVALVWRMRRGPERFVQDAAASLFIIGYVPLLGSFVTLMLAGDHGTARVCSFILCVVGSDTGGYVFGVLFGRHKMSPRISPKKTYEGLVGSFVCAMAVGAAMAHWALHVPAWVGVILGLVCTVVGTCGDLLESLVKRDVGIKDMSSFLPGHGGVMDRLDSLLLAAPAAWIVLFLLVPGG